METLLWPRATLLTHFHSTISRFYSLLQPRAGTILASTLVQSIPIAFYAYVDSLSPPSTWSPRSAPLGGIMVIHFPLYFTLRSPFYTLLFHYRFRQHGFYDFSPFIPPHTLLQCLKATYTLPVIWQFFHLFPNTSSSSEALSMFLVIFITSNNDENSVFRLGTRHPSLNRAENCSRIWTSHLRLYARSMLLLLLIEGFILPYAVQLGCWLYHAAERSVRLL